MVTTRFERVTVAPEAMGGFHRVWQSHSIRLSQGRPKYAIMAMADWAAGAEG